MSEPLSLPPIQAFERLQIADGLLITAERWQQAHNYHRQRQNFHFQSLSQAGIVCGLGVAVIPAPASIEARYRDQRWVQVQAGVAIDPAGNPIVVPQAEAFRIELDPPTGRLQTVYLVISYVDPDELRQIPGQAQVKEQFRIVETTEPGPLDVELCRIRLTNGTVQLRNALNVFSPQPNEVDLGHRRQAQPRPLYAAQVAYLQTGTPLDQSLSLGLSCLLQATEALFPKLQAVAPLAELSAAAIATADLSPFDLLYAPRLALQNLTLEATKALKAYLAQGGLLLITVDFDETKIDELSALRQELQAALEGLESDAEISGMRQQLLSEIQAIEADIEQQLQNVVQSLQPFAQMVGNPLAGAGQIHAQHPLRLQPFLFAQLPTLTSRPITLRHWQNIVLMIGNLAIAWGPDPAGQQTRESLRTAHELGINLLYFATRRRHLLGLQRPASTVGSSSSSQASLTDQAGQAGARES
ncbi:DUF4159 domain-containing protein [Almyronema epifaneia]|uniref:DUF4159 domain-containing protein n=1 Tax=Almyronema epifaneia S1 TaxID=2991925 RepID=A0ABW6ID90_9CYAN